MGKEGREEERGREGEGGAVGHLSLVQLYIHRRGPGEKINNLERG